MKESLVIILLLLQAFLSFCQEKEGASQKNEFIIVEKPAVPKGGYSKFYKYVAEQLVYPANAKQNGLEGKVYVQFVILESGSVDTTSVRTLSEEEVLAASVSGNHKFLNDQECHEIVVRIIKNMPAWEPAEHKGEFRKQRIIMPITFKL